MFLTAAKYKEYNKSRDILSGKLPVPQKENKRQTPRKRKHEGRHGEGTSKRQIIETPSKGTYPWEVDPYESPSVIRNLFTPSKKTVLGPTPQKDGQVLGLFDLLQEDGTPTKGDNVNSASLQVPIQATPRKAKTEDGLKHSRTPSAKRSLLHPFATPLKNRNSNGQGERTPSSVCKLHFSTPSFLRRDSQRNQLPPVNENADGLELSPQMVRMPRKPLVRGLSSILAGLRKVEEEVADEDLDALHEMENEAAGIPNKAPAKAPTAIAPPKDIQVEDSQPRLPLGGFDDEAMFDSEPEEPKGRDGQPLKVYKKKGQKRTTRRVKMKPVRSKPSQPSIPNADEESEDELGDAIPETQAVDEGPEFDEARNFDSDSQSEYTASEGGTRYKRADQSKKRKVMGRDGKIRTGVSKVTALANQNFKRLKLRNSGAKGGPAHNSRFRRRK
jgi:DNA replication regulator SLD2